MAIRDACEAKVVDCQVLTSLWAWHDPARLHLVPEQLAVDKAPAVDSSVLVHADSREMALPVIDEQRDRATVCLWYGLRSDHGPCLELVLHLYLPDPSRAD